ncbi:lysosomal acid lipase/cholesteryl ester hydrolase-like [Tiliqua scincoides]|uniref:lysosomal acid lipase/cholesteryl ester hydrolase-like n=1 Tax=Tiliqua scincoides TaxID=71010 RepID=UPI0034620F32
MNVSEIITYHGYPSEEYHVETKDNYILAIFRIPHGRYNGANKGPRPVVFLQHAILGDASHWISNLPNNSLGFILADAGYDVWLGNSRGNTWSVMHKTLKPSEQEFWEFSFHEMGYYDIPAVLYFILNKTGQPQLYYVGHSQGTAIGFIAFSSWPKLAKKIKVFFCLGPTTTLNYATTPLLKFLPYMPKILLQVSLSWVILLGNKQVLQSPAYLKTVFATFCLYLPKLCANVMFYITGSNTPNVNMSRLDIYGTHSPAGTSIQNLLHWIQVLKSKQFQAYDHGSPEKNMEKYNQTTPPAYKIEDIKIPIEFWSGGQDNIASPTDTEILGSRISNLIYKKQIHEWQHLDFIWGLDATERMYMKMMETMKKYSHCQPVKHRGLDKGVDRHCNHSFYEEVITPLRTSLKCYCD